eukprot:g67996.t1
MPFYCRFLLSNAAFIDTAGPAESVSSSLHLESGDGCDSMAEGAKALPKRVGLFGCTGGTGLATLRGLVNAGSSVQCLLRNPESLPKELRENKAVKLIVGDAKDEKSVDKVVEGADALIVSLGGRRENPKICSEAQAVINKSANKYAPNARMVVVTSLGVRESYDHCSFFTKALVNTIISAAIADKCIQEALVEKEIKNFVFVRPGGLVDGPGNGKWQASPTVSGGRIPREDVAAFILKEALCSDKWLKKGVSVVSA